MGLVFRIMTFKTLRTFETAFKRPTWKRRRRRGVLMGPYGQALAQWYSPLKIKMSGQTHKNA